MGNEYLAQTLMSGNVEVMANYKFKKIVVNCPHGYNTLKNEYPQFGGNYEVVHHTEFFLELLRAGKLPLPKGLNGNVAVTSPTTTPATLDVTTESTTSPGSCSRPSREPSWLRWTGSGTRASVLLRCRRRQDVDGRDRGRADQ